MLKSLLNKFESNLTNELFFEPDSKVLLAVSGGVDSITLLDLFANLTKKYPEVKLYVAHFNHKLRGKSSDRDEEYVKNISSNYNIKCFYGSGQVKEYSDTKGVGIEQAARTLRYKFLEKISKKVQANFVATAHTLDDSTETFFINLFRGAGISGLSGIPKRRILVKRIMLIRPLLQFKKSELIDYAKKRKLKWQEDESNKLLNYTRNKVRLDLIPKLEQEYNPALSEVISRTQKLFRGAESIINRQVQKAMQSLVCQKTTGRFGLKLSMLKIHDDFMKGEIIQKAIENNFYISKIPMKTIDRIIELEDKPVGSICEINKNYSVLRDREILLFKRNEKKQTIKITIEKEGEYEVGNHVVTLRKVRKNQVKIKPETNVEFVDWDLIPSVLYLRNWEQGDSFQPIGMNGTIKLSDFFVNNKISLSDKNDILILSSKSEIIWVCNMRLSDKFKITDETTRYLKIEYKMKQ